MLSKQSWISHQNVLLMNSCVLCYFCGVVECYYLALLFCYWHFLWETSDCVSVRSWIRRNIRTNFYLIDKMERKLCWNFILSIELSKVCQIWQPKEELCMFFSHVLADKEKLFLYMLFEHQTIQKTTIKKTQSLAEGKEKNTQKSKNLKFVFEVKKDNGKTLVCFHLQ